MIPKDCKRLAVVSRHSAREKSIRHGHPSTLHLWWARRPLAACRAMLLALLLPDPCDPRCPEEFKSAARCLLAKVPGGAGKDDTGLRKSLLKFIGDFADWDLSSNALYLEVSRGLVKAAHPDEPPLVVDPFAGGGSIPLEALRLGCEAFASDLNPVACLILKVMLEDIPRHGPELAKELRQVGAAIRQQAERELADLYPKDPDLPAPRRGKFFIYVLKCSNDSFYIGQTEDIPRRLKQHEGGEVSWTAKHLPVEIIHWEQFDSREAAVKREQDLKTGFGRKWLKREYEKGRLAARQAGGATPIAYLWARTVRCESPKCGAEIPLVRSFWLCKKAARKRALRYQVHHRGAEGAEVHFEIFEPRSDAEVPAGTVSRAKARCICCGGVLPPDRVRAQLATQRGGADVAFDAQGRRTGGARMLAVVTLHPGETGRHYRLPLDRDYEAVHKAQARLAKLLKDWEDGGKPGLCPVPDEPTPAGGGSGAGRAFSVRRYGMLQWGDLFTARQKVALLTLASQIRAAVCSDDVKRLLSLALDRIASRSSSLCLWRYHADQEKVEHIFGRQALPVVWDFAEAVVTSESTGSFQDGIEVVAGCIAPAAANFDTPGQLQQADACSSPLPDETVGLWFTDPPYYDAIPYSDLSDFFLVWLKRTVSNSSVLRDPFDPQNPLSPKTQEAVQDETRQYDGQPKDRAFFETVMARAFAEGRRILRRDGVGSVVFAHKTTEGWEALLSGLIRGGWVVTGSWPITTEMANRLRARESAALSASIHLVCRPRIEASVGEWREVLRQLPARVRDWMERLQGEGVRGADLVFACIGPALEIYSRYAKVVDAEEREIPLGGDPEAKEPHKRGYLAYVWEIVGRTALEHILGTAEAKARNGAALSAVPGTAQAGGALEEDARLTALFLWTLQSTNGDDRRGDAENGEEESEADSEDDEDSASSAPRRLKGFSLVFDVVRRFAQPLGIHLPDWEGRIVETEKGVVRLLPVAERAEQLFGKAGAESVAEQLEQDTGGRAQLSLFPAPGEDSPGKRRGRRGRPMAASEEESVHPPRLGGAREATTLDRVHAAMLLQASGRTNALRALLKAEQERGPDFLRLANALSALYPTSSEEKRLLDAMVLAVPR